MLLTKIRARFHGRLETRKFEARKKRAADGSATSMHPRPSHASVMPHFWPSLGRIAQPQSA